MLLLLGDNILFQKSPSRYLTAEIFLDYQLENLTMFGSINQIFADVITSKVQLNTAVTTIDFTAKTVKLYDQNDKVYVADKVIVTVPISELKANKINFIPALPTDKVQAFQNIGMDKGLKLFLQFDTKFFTHPLFNGQYVGYYIDLTKRNDASGKALLASLLMGKHAERYYQNPDKAVEYFLAELDRHYQGKASVHFTGLLTQDWGNEPYIHGAYSYTLPNGTGARQTARKPIASKVYFAGEAMNTRLNYGNVHGALESAMEVMRELQ
jgi:lysine-specific histone demethylase 1B